MRSRGESPAKGEANLLPASVPEIARSLRLARQLADLTLVDAAKDVGLERSTLEALEGGAMGLHHNRVETLRALRVYANSLGLPGDDYVLIAVENWSSAPTPTASAETAVVPVISISSAPAGGHTSWLGGATGVSDATTTGAIETVGGLLVHDTGRVPVVESASPVLVHDDTGLVPVVDTGEVPIVNLATPRLLKFFVVVLAILVVLGGVGLAEHSHVEGWFHDTKSSTIRWFHDAKQALGFNSKPGGHRQTSKPPSTGSATPGAVKVTMKADPSGRAETIAVASSSFTVKIVALKGPCWVEATAAGHSPPLYEQVLPAGQTKVFTVTTAMTIETGSSAGHAYIYKGTKEIGSFVPTKVPFTMNFTTAG